MRPFRFAVQSYSVDSPGAWRDRAKKIESLGYSALHLADHIIGPGPALDKCRHPVQNIAAVPAMAVAAEATTTLAKEKLASFSSKDLNILVCLNDEFTAGISILVFNSPKRISPKRL
jgi:hypothetical protein